MVLSHKTIGSASARWNYQKGLKEMEVTICCVDRSSLKLKQGVCYKFFDYRTQFVFVYCPGKQLPG